MENKILSNFKFDIDDINSIDQEFLDNFSDIAEFIHGLGLDWWQLVNMPRELARFGRKNIDGSDAKCCLGSIHFNKRERQLMISINASHYAPGTSLNKIKPIIKREILTKELLTKIKAYLDNIKNIWPEALNERSPKVAYWPTLSIDIIGVILPAAEMAELNKIQADKSMSATQKMTLIQARVGQGEFREKVLSRAKFKCEVTGVERKELLVASHILAWAKCETSEQRLDANNGLALSPNLDKLFDRGIISFDDDGYLIKKEADLNVCNILISPNLKGLTEKPNNEQCKYLQLHRKEHGFINN